MAFNGAGTFVRIYNWVTDKINLVPITASRMDAEMDDIATGLSNCITKDGTTTITGNISMNSHKFTGLSTGNARTDSLTLGQVQDGQFTAFGLTGGAADAYTASPSPAITAYVPTMEYSAKIHATNLTTNPTLLISAISGGTIKKLDASKAEIAVEASDMLAGGFYNFKRNVANDAWILLNPEKSFINLANANGYVVAATESVAGIAKIATQAETNTGTDDARFITPLKLRFGFAASFAASGYIAFPSWLGGFIIQWGTTTTSGSADVTVTFPFAFPTAAASIVLTQNNALTQGAWASVVSKTTSNFTCSGWTANTNRQLIGVNWYAIGY